MKLTLLRLKPNPLQRRLLHLAAVFASVATLAQTAFGANLLTPGDRTLAIDEDVSSRSSHPAAEGPANAIDGNPASKYLNGSGAFSGLIITPTMSFTSPRAIQFTTADDAPERDPKAWQLYGTMDDITSTNNSAGTNENWVLIASGTVNLPDERFTAGPKISIPADGELYNSYRIVFTSLKGFSTLMQVADVQLFDELDQPIVTPAATALAIQLPCSESRYPAGESAARAIDGVASTKYLNYGRENSGFIVTPSVGPSVATSFTITTANDFEGRDPSSYELYGSNDPIQSQDNSTGQGEAWTLISSGNLDLPVERNVAGSPVTFANTTSYRAYKILFRDNRQDGEFIDSIQIGDIQFDGTVAPQGTTLLRPADRLLAIDADLKVSSSFPTGENPANVLDANSATKYLNGGGKLTGLIVTPARGASVIGSFVITTANDAPERDPAAWTLYGTTDSVTSTNNSAGTNENWTVIASGTVTLPDTRLVAGPVVSFANSASYTSYKLIFTQLKSPTSSLMQIADVQFYESNDGTGSGVLAPGDAIVATALLQPQSSYNASEHPGRVVDGDVNTKYLNFGKENSGVIIIPSVGPSIVRNLNFVTANDSIGRDPASFQLFGTRGPVTSTDNSQGTNEQWTLIASGALALPDARLTAGDPITINNTTAYTAYKILFPTLKSANTVNSMQVAEIRFQGSVLRPLNVTSASGTLNVTWESSAGATYNLYWSTDLTTWTPLATGVNGDDRVTTRTYAHPAPGAPNFYIKVGQP